jgi:hypothetical protein
MNQMSNIAVAEDQIITTPAELPLDVLALIGGGEATPTFY